MPNNLNKDKLSKFNKFTHTINDLGKKKIEVNNRFSNNNQIYVNINNKEKIKIKNDSNNKISNSASKKNIYANSRQLIPSKLNMAQSQGKFITFNNLNNYLEKNTD